MLPISMVKESMKESDVLHGNIKIITHLLVLPVSKLAKFNVIIQ